MVEQFLGENPVEDRLLKAGAPLKPIEKVNITLVNDRIGQSLRYLTLKIQAPNVFSFCFTLTSADSFRKITVEGKNFMTLKIRAPASAVNLTIFIIWVIWINRVTAAVAISAGSDSVMFELRATSRVLFDKFIKDFEPRPNFMMPAPYHTDKVIWFNQIKLKELLEQQ